MISDWLLVTIFAYLFLGASSLCDKLALRGNGVQSDASTKVSEIKPKAYTFFVGVFGILAIFLIPFITFGFPGLGGLAWVALDALVHIVAIYAMYVALQKFEVSKVISTIIAAQSVFIFILTSLFWPSQIMSVKDVVAFLILLAGGILISAGKNIKVTIDYLKITLFSAFMFALDYVFLKIIFSSQPFLQGVVWIMIFIFLFGLLFLIKKEDRREIFGKQMLSNKRNQVLFLGSQVCGGAGNLLQSFAISLAPIAFLAVVNSLKGIQFAFLFLVVLFISYFYPKILKEDISKKAIVQKSVSIVIIAVGFIILAI
jgi:drug/metabolite transporter (DMT)-like permease